MTSLPRKIVDRIIEVTGSRDARARGFTTWRDMKNFSTYESRKTRGTLSQETVDRLREEYPAKTEEIELFDRAGDLMGDGVGFYALTALKAQYEKSPELKEKFPRFANLATRVLDKVEQEIKNKNTAPIDYQI